MYCIFFYASETMATELLEKRIKQLEDQLEEEKRRTQRERMAVTKLQNKLIKMETYTRFEFRSEDIDSQIKILTITDNNKTKLT
ncbi:unnamed protein product [Euphydryas editha]|uniref:Uncharacterized protein n=1 Tax=Euphydryas editha TaxID=104508 RepID=A0AAU9TQI0_EUPED|nr:unnamed protein product [Euphydryas editha]